MRQSCRLCCRQALAYRSLAPSAVRPLPVRKSAKETTKQSEYRSKFVDFCLVRCAGGRGGAGGVSMLKRPHQPRGGPDGGDGGDGGHVVFEASTHCQSLAHIPSRLTARLGGQGRGKFHTAANAINLVVAVPVGTVVYDIGQVAGEGEEEDDGGSSQLTPICQLNDDGEVYIGARGGQGGRGNKAFATAGDTCPRYAQCGGLAETRSYALELKLLAHAALVGFPNAGKSTLLRRISRARPKVASYPFTTLNPHVGIVKYNDLEHLSVADIPGIVPSSHRMSSDLALRFLRHIERCMCLVYVIDVTLGRLNDQWTSIRKHLWEYKPDMIDIPSIVLVNKCDLSLKEEGLDDDIDALREHINDQDIRVMPISGKQEKGLIDFLVHLRHICDTMDRDEWMYNRQLISLPATHEYVKAAGSFVRREARRDEQGKRVIYEEIKPITPENMGLSDEQRAKMAMPRQSEVNKNNNPTSM